MARDIGYLRAASLTEALATETSKRVGSFGISQARIVPNSRDCGPLLASAA